MKTKVVAVFMVVLLTVGLFAGCSQDSKDTEASGNNDAKTAEVVQTDAEQTEEDVEQEDKSYTFGATYMTLNNPFCRIK